MNGTPSNNNHKSTHTSVSHSHNNDNSEKSEMSDDRNGMVIHCVHYSMCKLYDNMFANLGSTMKHSHNDNKSSHHTGQQNGREAGDSDSDCLGGRPLSQKSQQTSSNPTSSHDNGAATAPKYSQPPPIPPAYADGRNVSDSRDASDSRCSAENGVDNSKCDLNRSEKVRAFQATKFESQSGFFFDADDEVSCCK